MLYNNTTMPTKKEINYNLLQAMDAVPDYVYKHFIGCDEELDDAGTKLKFIACSDEIQKIYFLHKVMCSNVRQGYYMSCNLRKVEKQLADLQDMIRQGTPKPKIMKSDAMKPYERYNPNTVEDEEDNS